MNINRNILGTTYLACGLLLGWFASQLKTPEAYSNLLHLVVPFLIFLLFTLGAFSWGALIRKKFNLKLERGPEEGLFDLAFGTMFLYGVSYALTLVHLFSSSHWPILWVFLTLGIWGGAQHLSPRKWILFPKNKFARFFAAIPLLIVFIRLLEGVQFHQHGDAYVAYLPGPRFWAVSGNFNDFLRFTQLFLTTSWESMYAWGTALMGLTGGNGLDATQVFAQWCVGGIGIFGTVLATYAICEKLSEKFEVSPNWFPLAAITAVQIPSLRWTANLAKNDVGVAFWGLAAFYFTFFVGDSLPVAFLAGFMTGAAVIGKLTLALLGICLGVAMLIRYPKNVPAFVAGGFLGVAPVLIRNFLVTGNPLFPWLANVFPTPYLSVSMLPGALSATSHPFGISNLPGYFVELFNEMPIVLGLIAVVVLSNSRKKIIREIWVPFAGLILFTLVFRSSITEVRYHSSALVAAVAMSTFFSFYGIQKYFKKWSLRAQYALAIFIVLFSNISFFSIFQIGSKKYLSLREKISHHVGGEGKLWIRDHLDPKSKILVVGDQHIYYIQDYNITEVIQSVEWDAKIEAQDTKTFEKTILKSDMDYLYLTSDLVYWIKNNQIPEMLRDTNGWDQSCKRLNAEKTQIWDLKCLRSHQQT